MSLLPFFLATEWEDVLLEKHGYSCAWQGIAIIDAGTIDAGIIDAELLMLIF